MKKLILILLVYLCTIPLIKAQNKDLCIQNSDKCLEWFQENQSDSIYALFDKTMKSAIDIPTLNKIWSGFLNSDGKFVKSDPIKLSPSGKYLVSLRQIYFEQKSYKMKLVFNSENQISGMFFIPYRTHKNKVKLVNNEYFEESQTYVKNGRIKLPAIFTRPKNVKSFPVVVFVHGSGPNDMDETIGPNKIFKDLAHNLAKQGIGSLRYDKRTYLMRTSKENLPIDGLNDVVIDDAIAAVKLAQRLAQPSTDVFLLGHSLGASLSPKIAIANKDIKGIIMMAAAARPLEDLVYEQYKYLYKKDGLNCTERKDLHQLKRKVKRVKKIDAYLLKKSIPELPLTNDTSFWRDIHHYNAVETAQNIHIPTLILQGERDYQVNMKDYKIWMEQLSNRKNFQLKSYPKLNHIFHEGEGLSYPEEYGKAGNIPDYVLSDISKWILNNL